LSKESDEPIAVPIDPDLDIGEEWVPTNFDGEDFAEEEPLEDLWAPDVWIEEIEGSLVVTLAPPAPDGKRLFGGDRVVTIDGTNVMSMEAWDALELLYGPEGSICTITADRPATHESVTVSLPRTKPADEI